MDPAKLRAEAEKELEQARIHMARAAVYQKAAQELEGMSRAGENERPGPSPTPGVPVRELDFVGAMRAKGFTYKTLAQQLGVSLSTITTHRLDKSNQHSRPIPESRARNIEKLIGWPATAAAWPAGIRIGR